MLEKHIDSFLALSDDSLKAFGESFNEEELKCIKNWFWVH
jgi:hypothetical protein